MSKTMCDLVKSDSEADREKAAKWAQDAQYACKKCGRKAARKKHLCKPESL